MPLHGTVGQLLNRLIAAGVGQRPVIFVTHRSPLLPQLLLQPQQFKQCAYPHAYPLAYPHAYHSPEGLPCEHHKIALHGGCPSVLLSKLELLRAHKVVHHLPQRVAQSLLHTFHKRSCGHAVWAAF